MKKNLNISAVLLIVLALTFGLSSVASAKDSVTSDSVDSIKGPSANSGTDSSNDASETLREAAKQKLEDLRGQIKNEKDAAKAKIKEDRIKLRENALGRFDAAVNRIDGLVGRVNALIPKLEAKGVDVASAKSLVATSVSKLADARVKITAINALLSTSINELSAQDKINFATLAKDTQGLISDARLALMDAIKSLKTGVGAKMDSGDNGNDGNN